MAVQRSMSNGILREPLPFPFLSVLAQVLGEPSPARTLLRKQCPHCSEQGRVDLTRASLSKHSCLPDVCKVSRERNQPQRARLILQTLTHEEPLTAKAGGPWVAERVDPNPQPGKVGSVGVFVEYFPPLITKITNLQSFTPLSTYLLLSEHLKR